MKTFQTLCKDLRGRTKKIARKIFVRLSRIYDQDSNMSNVILLALKSADSPGANCGTDRLSKIVFYAQKLPQNPQIIRLDK